MQPSLDCSVYKLDNVPLYESIYGKNLISLGGFDAIENMFSDQNLKGLKALDIGFGLGGVAFYLARKYQMHITGIEVHAWMKQYAEMHTPDDIASQLKFDIYQTENELPYQSDCFDMVYSKGVLNHIREKAPLFQEVNRVLKPEGLFVIADWIFPKGKVADSEAFVCETQESYQHVLKASHFKEVTFRDDSMKFLTYAQRLLERLIEYKYSLEKTYGDELISIISQQHQGLIQDVQQKKKIATRIIAKKVG